MTDDRALARDVNGDARGEGRRMRRAAGAFEVKMTGDPAAEAPAIGRFALDKTYRGGLEATSRGQMLSAGAVEKGSAGYVAIEIVEGTLDGRSGSFALQHSGTMTRGSARLTNGEAHVVLGGTFALVANPDLGLTAHLTPRGRPI